jgi:hypothetical protein
MDMSTNAGGQLGDLIAVAESGKAAYDAFTRGVPGEQPDTTVEVSKMSISEVLALQGLPSGDPKRLFAVGKYLLIPMTLRSAVTALKIDGDEKYSPALQEKIFRDYLIAIKRPQVKNYVTGSSTGVGLADAQTALAREFASVGDPSTGRSIFAGAGENRAIIAPADTARALNNERAAYLENLSRGLSPEQAWDALSPGIEQ